VGGWKYRMDAIPSTNFKNSYVIVFKLLNNPKKADFKGNVKQFLKDKEEEEMGDVGIGGVKNTISVLRNVFSMTKNFITDYHTDRIIFHARNDKRAKIYEKFSNDLANKVGYKSFKRKGENNSTEFHLVKNDESIIKETLEYFK
jgi:hypothetical protein